MAAFRKNRRRPDGGAPEGGQNVGAMALTPDDDPVLQAQLAHLDAIEQRHEDRYARLLAEAARTEAESGDPPLPEEAWPAAIGEPPAPDGGSLAPYVAWVERARSGSTSPAT